MRRDRRTFLRAVGAAAGIVAGVGTAAGVTETDAEAVWPQPCFGPGQGGYRHTATGPVETAGFDWERLGLLTGDDPGSARRLVADGDRVYVAGDRDSDRDPDRRRGGDYRHGRPRARRDCRGARARDGRVARATGVRLFRGPLG